MADCLYLVAGVGVSGKYRIVIPIPTCGDDIIGSVESRSSCSQFKFIFCSYLR